MKKVMLLMVFIMSSLSLFSQTDNSSSAVKNGDLFTIGSPENEKFKNIHFPKANIIIKRGGVPNFRKVIGQKVVVHSVESATDGGTTVTLKRQDGGRFFGSHLYIKANYDKALETRELIE